MYEPSSLTTIFGMWERQPSAPKPRPQPVAVREISKPVAISVGPKSVALPEAVAVSKPKPKIENPVAKPRPSPEPVPKPKTEKPASEDEYEKPRRLRIIQRMLEKSDVSASVPSSESGTPVKPKKATVMSKLWAEAKSKGVPGYNRMKRADLELALQSK